MRVRRANARSMIVCFPKKIHYKLVFSVFEIDELKEGKHYQVEAELNYNLKQ